MNQNCQRVNRTAGDAKFQAFARKYGNDGNRSFIGRAVTANDLCKQAYTGFNSDPLKAANFALQAWGDVLMEGRECCNLVDPPFCRSSADSRLLRQVLFALSVVVVLLVWTAHRLFPVDISAPSLWTIEERAEGARLADPGPQPRTEVRASSSRGGRAADRVADSKLWQDLHTLWLGCGLAHLPGARSDNFFGPRPGDAAEAADQRAQNFSKRDETGQVVFDESSARTLQRRLHDPEDELRGDLLSRLTDDEGKPTTDSSWPLAYAAQCFFSLQRAFGFQEDNARNQFEHLLSLWRTHCSVFADNQVRYIAAVPETAHNWDIPTNLEKCEQAEGGLLLYGLREFHGDQLCGFLQWRRKMMQAGLIPHDAPDRSWWRPLGVENHLKLDDQGKLQELAAYLLVWGEAGNLRFMPEVIYFITELVLSAANPGDGGMFAGLEIGQSGRFLVHVVRPIYNTIFDAHYEQKPEGPLGHRLRPDCAKFLPADVPNHDDWNELFGSPERLRGALVLRDGTRFYTDGGSAGARLATLPQVDWAKSLRSENVKTHREMHSIWGFFAGTHRLWFLHAFLFAWIVSLMTLETHPAEATGPIILGGRLKLVRLAAIGLLVPLHTACWRFARWFVAGRVVRSSPYLRWWYWRLIPCYLPIFTYAGLRYLEYMITYQCIQDTKPKTCSTAVGKMDTIVSVAAGHLFFSCLGAATILFFPWQEEDYVWGKQEATDMLPSAHTVGRYLFWAAVLAVKIGTGLNGIRAMVKATEELYIAQPTRQVVQELPSFLFGPNFDKGVVEWLALWGTGFMLFVADTGFWFAMGCTVLGGLIALHHRGWRVADLTFTDAVAAIPHRFSTKVIGKTSPTSPPRPYSGWFPDAWDRIVAFMRYEDKISDDTSGQLSFTFQSDVFRSEKTDWASLQDRRLYTNHGNVEAVWAESPQIFSSVRKCPDRCLMRDLPLCRDRNWPTDGEVQWRLTAFGRSLMYDIPEPFRTPYMPGLTVLIPHYGESILLKKDELWKASTGSKGDSLEVVPLMSWLEYRYEEEFQAFMSRQSRAADPIALRGAMWDKYRPEDWEKLCAWASMRSQTLWRTVAGMMYYRPALEFHKAMQDRFYDRSRLLWDVDEVFTCMITMQRYRAFSPDELNHTERMLTKFDKNLKIAFIDDRSPRGENFVADGIHSALPKRYYSCLIDKLCPMEAGPNGNPTNFRSPKYKIELPGWPILGDGKGDNQNHAIVFTRGSIIQAIDANQGGYFEQMLLLPCALGEFRRDKEPTANRKGVGRRIVGFPEHIFSDIGSVGEFAAGAETAFGTVLQRAYAWLGARMHYGHPDMMNKTFMMQQGGISKATKTVNLSEDIFAGMDFTLRGQGVDGQGREIKHCEYFHLTKGRDMGFSSVLTFFAKLSSGTGEQLLTRQVFRLGHTLGLPEFLTFYYAHGGFYFTQLLLSKGIPLLVYIWLLVVLDDPESSVGTDSRTRTGAEIVATMLVTQFSWLLLLFAIATTMPLFLTCWLESGFIGAFLRIIKQMLTLAPLLFIFQAKIIGTYLMNEIRNGGAKYAATGRGLPTERKPFVAKKDPKEKKFLGLYNDFAPYALYDGARLFAAVLIVAAAGGLSVGANLRADLGGWCVTLALTICAWLLAPFVFNPYQFAWRKLPEDLRLWWEFFDGQGGSHWAEWYEEVHLRLEKRGQETVGPGLRATPTPVVISLIFFGSWYTILQSKVHLLAMVWGKTGIAFIYTVTMMPPVFSFLICAGLVFWYQVPAGQQPVRLIRAVAIVVAADIIETVVCLASLMMVGWWKTCFAGLLLKYTALSLLLQFCECLFCLKQGGRCPDWLVASSRLWLYSHRMARDFVVSLLIYAMLLPFVIFDFVRSFVTDLSVHNLIIYRDPGHQTLRASEGEGLTSGTFRASVRESLQGTAPSTAPGRPTGGASELVDFAGGPPSSRGTRAAPAGAAELAQPLLGGGAASAGHASADAGSADGHFSIIGAAGAPPTISFSKPPGVSGAVISVDDGYSRMEEPAPAERKAAVPEKSMKEVAEEAATEDAEAAEAAAEAAEEAAEAAAEEAAPEAAPEAAKADAAPEADK